MGVYARLNRALAYSKGLRVFELDGFERLIAGFFGRPDRVPVLIQPYTYAMGIHGLSSRIFFREPVPFVNASYNTTKYFGFDFFTPVFDFYNIELEAMGAALVWRHGSEPDVDSRSPLIPSEEEFRKLKPPVPGKSGRMPYILESYRRFMDIMELPPMCYCCSPFTMAVLARGYVGFLRDMRRNPAFAHRLMEFLSMEVVVPWIDSMVKVAHPSMVVMSDAWASAPNMKVDAVREFCLPYVQKVIKATNSLMRTVLDTGSWGEREAGDPREILDVKMEMMAGNPVSALRPLFLLVWAEDYEALGVPVVREYSDEKNVCLMLNVRPELIEEGPPERIFETVRGLIRDGAGKGRFALLANLVPIGTPHEHVHALVQAARSLGRYTMTGRKLGKGGYEPTRHEPFEDWLKREGLPVD